MKDTEENQGENKQGEISQEDLQVIELMTRLHNNGMYRYQVLAIQQERNQIHKSIGQTLVNIGKLLEEHFGNTEEEEEIKEEPKKKGEIKEEPKKILNTKKLSSFREYGNQLARDLNDKDLM